jgi:hypothetical protein
MASTLKTNANRLNMDTYSPTPGSYGRNSGIFKPRRGEMFIWPGAT